MVSLNRIAAWSTGLFVVLAGWLAAQATWDIAAMLRPVALPPQAAVSTRDAVADAASNYDVGVILATPLFGEKTENPSASADIKRSRLKIRLLGVIAGGSRSGVAILYHDGEGRAYAVGDRLDVRENVTLEAVLADHVIIDRSGSREKIELEGDAVARGKESGVRVIGDSADTVDLNTPAIRTLVGDPKQTLKTSPLKLMRFLQVKPHTRDGQTIGFEVQPGRDERLFPKLGLKAGDVVISINNQPVADVAVSDLIDSLDTYNTFELVVLRNGVPETIRLSL